MCEKVVEVCLSCPISLLISIILPVPKVDSGTLNREKRNAKGSGSGSINITGEKCSFRKVINRCCIQF